MNMIREFCDRCGKEVNTDKTIIRIEKSQYIIHNNPIDGMTYSQKNINDDSGCYLCFNCQKSLKNLIKSWKIVDKVVQ